MDGRPAPTMTSVAERVGYFAAGPWLALAPSTAAGEAGPGCRFEEIVAAPRFMGNERGQ